MARKKDPCPWESDVKHLIHAVEAAGKEVRGVTRHNNGDITAITDKDAVRISGADETGQNIALPLDEWRAKRRGES